MKVRSATYEDYCKIVEWSTRECDWELCKEDFLVWKRFLPADSFTVSEDSEGNVTGFIASVIHTEMNFGQISMFYVKENRRGQGFGSLLWTNAMNYLKGTSNVFLSSEPEMVEKYNERSGFNYVLDWKLMDAVGKPRNFKSFVNSTISSSQDEIFITQASEIYLPEILLYDKEISKVDRSLWCQNWLLAHPTGLSFVALCKGNNKVCGYGSVRIIRNGAVQLDPLYADSEIITRKLIAKLLSSADGIENRELRFYYHSNNKSMTRISVELGLNSPYFSKFMFTNVILNNFNYGKVFCFSGCDVNYVV